MSKNRNSQQKETGQGEKNGKAQLPIPEALKGVLQRTVEDPLALERFPQLMELLIPRFSEGKQITEAGRLTISLRGSHWEVRLECPTYLQQCIVVPTSLVTALEGLEGALAQGSVTWSPVFRKKRISTIDEY